MTRLVWVFIVVMFLPVEGWAQSNAPLMQMKRKWIKEDSLPYFTDSQFPMLKRDGVLVKIQDTKYHVLDGNLDRDAQYIRPAVLDALRPFEIAFYARFKHPFRINGAFRTVEHHAELRLRNPNAATGNSPHSTGYTVDISLLAMSVAERRFTEAWFGARNKKRLVFTIEHKPLTMYDIFFRPPQLEPPPTHRHRSKAR